MLTHILPGVIGIVASALIGIIGILSNLHRNCALKLVLLLLLVVVAAIGLYREYEISEVSAMEREKTVYAESHAAQSLQELTEAKEALKREGKAHAAAREELNDRLVKNQALLESLFNRLVAINVTLTSMDEAAAKGQRHKIAEIGRSARDEARLTLMSVARQESLLPESEIAKIESDLENGEPIPPADLERIQANMAAKHRLERSPDGTPPPSHAPAPQVP